MKQKELTKRFMRFQIEKTFGLLVYILVSNDSLYLYIYIYFFIFFYF